jgi:hypothetical protein
MSKSVYIIYKDKVVETSYFRNVNKVTLNSKTITIERISDLIIIPYSHILEFKMDEDITLVRD